MRLINVKKFRLEEFLRDETPPYAILSHTWGLGEVSFADFVSGNWLHDEKKKGGREKIIRCCAIAAEEGFTHTWIDTCCIDKTSSAELSEAINSMFQWYYDSAICFAYLSDVDSSADPASKESEFSTSRWFRRGWTLQELLAPSEVVFLGSDWGELGTKRTMHSLIQSIANISSNVLSDRKWNEYSVAQRMSWASDRQTTRLEDEAYCLLGLFNVNMPLLYGEGQRAFFRLQTEIMRQTDDESIFAWSYPTDMHSHTRVSGLLASTPTEFRHAPEIVNVPSENRHLTLQNLNRSQGYSSTFELVHRLVLVKSPAIGPLVSIELGEAGIGNDIANLEGVIGMEDSLPNTHHEQDAKEFTKSDIPSVPELILQPSDERDEVDLLTGGSRRDMSRVHTAKPSSTVDDPDLTQVESTAPDVSIPDEGTDFEDVCLDRGNWQEGKHAELPIKSNHILHPREGDQMTDPLHASDENGTALEVGVKPSATIEVRKSEQEEPKTRRQRRWYIYEPIIVAPLLCEIQGKGLAILLSRGPTPGSGGVLSRIHCPSLVCIEDPLRFSEYLSSTREIYVHGTIEQHARKSTTDQRLEIRVTNLIDHGYTFLTEPLSQWDYDGTSKTLTKPRDRETRVELKPLHHFFLFTHKSGDIRSFPSIFLDSNFEKPIFGFFTSHIPSKASIGRNAWRIDFLGERRAEIALPGSNQAFVLKRRELSSVEYLHVSLEATHSRLRTAMARPINSDLGFITTRLQRMSRT